MTVELVVPGEPVAWQRARTNGTRHFTDPKVAEFQERCRVAWMVAGRARLGDLPLVVSAEFVFARKPSHLRADGSLRATAPVYPRQDCDNLLKGILDALQGEGLLFDDDSQVVELDRVRKRYIEPGEEPHTSIVAKPFSEN